MGNCNSTGNLMAARIDKQLYAGRLYPYPVGACHYSNTGQHHPKSESHLSADSKIRSQDRGRRGARPARREEGEYIDVFNRRATQQVGMDRRPNPEVIFESALKRLCFLRTLHKLRDRANGFITLSRVHGYYSIRGP